MITKKLGKITFGWDPTAQKGKGYWYVLGKDDSFARAASQAEVARLGVPKQSDMPKKDAGKHKYYYDINKKTGKPVRKRFKTGTGGADEEEPSKYETADITAGKSLAQLASERHMAGQGIGSSLKDAFKDKIGAKATNFKKKFDPMNMLSKIPGVGKLAATAYGKKRGRSAADISYFTGVRAPDTEMKEEGATASKSGGKGGLGDSKGIMTNLYKLIADKFEEDKKLREIDKSFEEERKSEDEKRHKELIDAILKGKSPKEKGKKEEKKPSWLDAIGSMFGSFFGKFGSLATSILRGIGGFAMKLGRGVLSAGKAVVKGGINLAKKAGGAIKSGFSSMKSGLGMGKSAIPEVKALDTAKSALVQAKPGTAVKVAETAEKAGASIAKAGGTASKVAGAGSKLLKGGSKLLGFLKSIPGLGVIAAGADLVMRVQEVNDKLKSGEIKDSEYKKEITKAIGDAAAAGALPVLGAAIGSVVPGVGTLVGGLAGGAAALMGGDKIGGYVAEKAYDYFVDDKKGGDQKKATATAVSSAAATGATTASSPSTPKASAPSAPSAQPVATPPKEVGARAAAATQENRNLTGPVATAGNESPTIVNKTTNVQGGKGGSSSGGSTGGVRDDEPVLTKIQYGNMRAV